VLKKRGIMGKSQETQQLAVGMSGKCGFGSYRPTPHFATNLLSAIGPALYRPAFWDSPFFTYGFFLRRTPQQAAGFFTCRNNSAYGMETKLPPHMHHTLLWANVFSGILIPCLLLSLSFSIIEVAGSEPNAAFAPQ
jgi:hypothetical protein